MKKLLVLAILMGGLAALPGCFGEKCGPFPATYFKVYGLDVNNITKPDSSWTIDQYNFPEYTTYEWAKVKHFGINIDAKVNYVTFNKKITSGHGSAFACSPPEGGEKGSKEIIENILITSDSVFDAAHAAGESLNEFFMVSAISSYHYSEPGANLTTAIPMAEFLSSQPKARRSLQFWIAKKPEQSKRHRFTIKYTQTNGEEFIVTAPMVIFQ
ncbi:MAG: hypothetical protein EOO03_17065 [Chitinophagaceae bacterium]|nr:MAG: hypothetical protein EOO03_17065 [Chitinophagaceae bacterium]